MFYGFVCFPVLISFKSIWVLFELKNKLCLVFALFLWVLVRLSLESKQWINKNALWFWYCGFFELCCIRIWYKCDSSGIVVFLNYVAFGFGTSVTVLYRDMSDLMSYLGTGIWIVLV